MPSPSHPEDPAPGGPLEALAVVLATGFGSGLSPAAPGTAGTAVAVPLAALALAGQGPQVHALAVVAVAAVAIWSAGVAAPRFGLKDPGQIVVDEVAGFFVAMAFLPVTVTTLAAAFLLFRAFDIAKPPPCRQAEGFPGGLGIVADDLLAGLYANLSVRVLGALGIFSL